MCTGIRTLPDIRAICFVFNVALVLVSTSCCCADTRPVPHDPRAVTILRRMVQAYRELKSLDLEVAFTVATIPLPAPDHPFGIPPRADTEPASPGQHAPQASERQLEQRIRLRFVAPNRLRLELHDTDPESGRSRTALYLSDGRTFWSYIPEKNWYTREKAPRNLRAFSRLQHFHPACLELLMLMGIDPFQELKQVADQVRYLGTQSVRGVPTEVVELATTSRAAEVLVHLHVGQRDSLLYRIVHITTPVPGPIAPGKVGDALDALIDAPQPPPMEDPELPAVSATSTSTGPVGPFRTRVTCENRVTTSPVPPPDAFQFIIPPGALLYGPTENPARRKSGMERLREIWQRSRSFPSAIVPR
ncbi:MAG: DUF2092 domain-containing protein [Chloroherpetonaceae bacterium]|nr:DUF2092 domain-containing protein [Chthonomonadaceae bacterium]MDW8208686.1 DUF2092 domain-containing protein [Chloroherpetonaceae bacterium]